MRIVTIASTKGGAGKTTLAAHLAVEAERTGAGPVAVVDTDPQGSLAAWWNGRKASTPVFASVEIGRLAAHLATLERHNVELVMIEAAVSVADVVVIPARPSPHDLRSIGTIVEMVERMGKPFCFVVNGATPRTTIATDALRALAQHGRVAPVTIHARIDFAASMIDGRTVGEVHAQSRSTQEITELWIYVNSQLRRNARG